LRGADPSILRECAARWLLQIAETVSDGRGSVIAFATRPDGQPVVLKLRPPGSDFVDEVTTLGWYAGRGAVRVLESDTELGALLLERIVPGDRLTRLVEDGRDDEATLMIAGVMARLRAVRETGVLPTLPPIERDADALSRLRTAHAGTTGPLPAYLVESAESLVAELVASVTAEATVLHADLHHDNVLGGASGAWLAIDPKGRLGEAACEAAAFLRNPLPVLLRSPNLREVLARRADLLAESLQVDRERMLAWAFVLAVVAACWQLEDREAGWAGWIHIANALSRIA
jgi:streptomycin 6-kinase